MNFYESFKQAMESLKSNKLRSFLTMLGIVMGVFSVITIIAIGNAAEAYMTGEFEKLGANVIRIKMNTKSMLKQDWLTLDDISLIKRAVPSIKNIDATAEQYGEIRLGSKNRDAFVEGVGSQIRSFSPMDMVAGRFINELDISTKSKFIVVEENFAKRYYKKTDIIGETIKLKTTMGNTTNLKVIGVVKSENGVFDTMMGEEFPAVVYVPVTTVQQMYNIKKVDTIYLSLDGDIDVLKAASDRIIRVLEFKHGNKDKYSATNTADMKETFSQMLGIISSVLLVIAIITLIVGGIGIINILLVSVTERIREIGIRKALGAQKKDIIIQFLTESIIMTGISGIIGIVLGITSGMVISYLIKIPPMVDFGTVIMSFLGSVLLGLAFGVYPAKKAVDLHPIESLRYE